jgi:hypothetical protein
LDGNDIPLVQTKNLFDKDNVFPGFINQTNGNFTNAGTFNASGFIPIFPSTTYTQTVIATGGTAGYAFYNSSQVYISGGDSLTFTTPATAAFIRVSIRLATLSINDYQLEQGATATSYAPYGFLTLNEIFKDGNILLNSDFSNGSTNWNLQFATGSVSDNIFTYTPTGNFGGITQSVNMINSNLYFISSNVKSLSNSTNLSVSGVGLFNHTGSNTFETLNNRFTWTSATGSWVYRIQTTTFNPNDNLVNGIKGNYLLNLTTLGISNLTTSSIQNYLNDFLLNNAYIEGYDDGFEVGYDDGFDVGYDEGFDDGVASDTSYAVGYALGLSEGEDMETGSSLLILIVALIGFVMMIFGFTTKRGIFNL